jgi:hypothetical protein
MTERGGAAVRSYSDRRATAERRRPTGGWALVPYSEAECAWTATALRIAREWGPGSSVWAAELRASAGAGDCASPIGTSDNTGNTQRHTQQHRHSIQRVTKRTGGRKFDQCSAVWPGHARCRVCRAGAKVRAHSRTGGACTLPPSPLSRTASCPSGDMIVPFSLLLTRLRAV